MNKSVIKLVLIAAIAVIAWAQEDYQRISVQEHDKYRAMHQVGPLTMSNDLNQKAVQCAQYYSTRGSIDHSCPHKDGAGENLWMSSGNPSNVEAVHGSINSWYAEETKHNYSGDWQPGSGHFTQMVWKGSNEHGFGVAHGSHGTVGVGLYLPHGNIIGQFQYNVFPKQ